MLISDLVGRVGYKRITDVECSSLSASNQNELNGVTSLKEIFGTNKTTIDCNFIYLSEFKEIEKKCSSITWYNARENDPKRNEYRLYYKNNSITLKMKPGDLFVIFMYMDSCYSIICEQNSTYENQIIYLFDIDNLENRKIKLSQKNGPDLNFTRKIIFENIGFYEGLYSPDKDLDQMLELFGRRFPSTKDFSKFARDKVGNQIYNDLSSNSDKCIIAWLEKEESLFYTFEKYFVSEKLKLGFKDVDDFIKYSLSVQNRRKSRIGYSLENHIEEIFIRKNIQYSRGKVTEGKSRPDFIFPSIEKYHDKKFSCDNLTMLGVKSSCKDRWRQILTEAKRINPKHLFTLEPSISENQTNEMKINGTVLVVPESIHHSYNFEQRKNILSFENFLKIIS